MIAPFVENYPTVPSSVFIAESAQVIGNVTIGAYSSIWFGSVVRGDVHYIRIGERTNIQDLSVLHVTRKTHPLVVGNEVTVGHHTTLHGCTIFDRTLIGMGAIVLDGAVVSAGSIVGAGALVPEGMIVPSGVLVVGVPAKVRRELTPEEKGFLLQSSKNYVELAQVYLKQQGE